MYLPEDFHNEERRETIETFTLRFRSAMCAGCGFAKAPGKRCQDCYINGRTERGKKVVSPARQKQLAEARRKLKAEQQKRFEENKKRAALKEKVKKERKKIRGRKRTNSTYETVRRRRAMASRWMMEIIDRFVLCFEHDEHGALTIYADTIADTVKPLLTEIGLILPRVKETFEPYKDPKDRGGP